MKKEFQTSHIKLHTSKDSSCNIFIGISLQEAAADIARKFRESKCYIITDSNVKRLYANTFQHHLKECGIETYLIDFKAGESSKIRKTKEVIEDKLLKLRADRSSIIIALGGGVVGDLAGFAAATLNRGVTLIQIPTTLLAQIDSSIGGKVGVNHPLGKNLIGTYYQPNSIYIDLATLNTLSDIEYSNGLAEIVKYGAILDENLFSYLENNCLKIIERDIRTLFHIIKKCCTLKVKVVQKDELETGYRKILNFGHTIGHAFEKLSDYKVSHGHAISVGMAVESFIAYKLNMLDLFSVTRLETLLEIFNLPTRIPKNFSVTDVVNATMLDKKSIGKLINYTLINKIGSGVINIALSAKTIKHILKSI